MKTVLGAVGAVAAGLLLGVFLFFGYSTWSARQELAGVRSKLAVFRANEIGQRVRSWLPPDEREVAETLFLDLETAAERGRVDPQELIDLRLELERSTSDFALDPTESRRILERVQALAR